MPRVLGRLTDLERRDRSAREQRLADVLVRWSLAANHEWLQDGVRRDEPFLQISTAAPGSVLAWELAQLHASGYVPIGPLWLPVRWLRDADGYRRCVRLVAEHCLAATEGSAPHYVAKVHGELEPLLAMWPHVLLLPTSRALSLDDLIELRAWPVRPLGVVVGPTRGDGAVRSPAEFFAHDLDHARFQVREDLLARGVVVPDPYVDGDTFDRARGMHRAVMHTAVPHVDADGWRQAAARSERAHGWLAAIDARTATDAALAEAARWLLFELVHEKSLPLEVGVLTAALAGDTHTAKLAQKATNGFFGVVGPSPTAVARLPDARSFLATTIAAGP